MHTFLTVATSEHAGLTSSTIGLVRALDRIGMRVGFFKPISQSYHEQSDDLSTAYIRQITSLEPPEPMSMEETGELLSSGKAQDLLEKITELYQSVTEGCDVVIVEGLQASSKNHFLNDLNPRIAQALNAEVILVSSARGNSDKEICEKINRRLEAAHQAFTDGRRHRVVGVLANQGKSKHAITLETIRRDCPMFAKEKLNLLGFIPYLPSLTYPYTRDLITPLGGSILHKGELASRRVTKIHLCARDISHLTHVFHAGSLVVTPADRSDIIISTAYASLSGIPLAGLVLTGETDAEPQVLQYCHAGISSGLPVITVPTTSFETAQILNSLNPEIPPDDTARLELLVEHVARHVDSSWLRDHCKTPENPRLSPPAFRHQIAKIARQAPQRIILPEGEEPRIIKAAVRCIQRDLASPILLGKRDTIQQVADHHGVKLPQDISIYDPDDYRAKYVEPLLELRKHKNLTFEQAQSQLEDDITLATMMLACGHVDGLVAGAVHSTADTIRPALQLIRTAEGAAGVSSVFFMCLPDQVLVYGDCAVNPDPDANLLADIAIQSEATAKAFGINPRLAMISYSTLGSGIGANVDKVREATAIVKEKRPDIIVDGPLQYDTASDPEVARTKAPDSLIQGNATVFVFPDLNTGNTTYKAVEGAGQAIVVGPVMQGLRMPVNDLSRGATVENITFTIAITSIQAQQHHARS